MSNGLVFVTDEFRKATMARQIPGCSWHEESSERPKGWYFDPSTHKHAGTVAIALFPELRANSSLQAPLTGLDHVRPTDLATPWAQGKDPHELLPGVPDRYLDVLFPYQLADLGFLRARLLNDGGGVLGWDRGMGKTFGGYLLALTLRGNRRKFRVLVVTNRKAKKAIWLPEPKKWDLPVVVHDIGGTAAQRNRVVREWSLYADDDISFAAIHPEALRLIDWKALPKIDMVIFDESHKLANGGNAHQRGVPAFYKALKTIKSDYRLGLSGSIIVNGPEDFFGTLHWVLPERYKRRWADWNDRYLEYVQGSAHKTLVDVNRARLPEMKRELGAFITVRFKQDELENVPKVLPQDIRVDLGKEQRRVYDEMAESLVAELPDGTRLRAENHMVKLMRLRQIACGLQLVDSGEPILADDAKVEAALGLIVDNLPHKTVVFTWHRAAADSIQQHLDKEGVGCAKVYGGMSDTASQMEIDRFNRTPDCKVFVGTMKSVGESINLNAAESGGCSDVVFVETSWVPTDMEQAQDRVAGGLRQLGQKRRISVTRVIARDTVDEYRVIPTLESKAAIRKLILGGTA